MIKFEELGLPLHVKFFDRTFQDLCVEARRDKKPILIIMLRDLENGSVTYLS